MKYKTSTKYILAVVGQVEGLTSTPHKCRSFPAGTQVQNFMPTMTRTSVNLLREAYFPPNNHTRTNIVSVE